MDFNLRLILYIGVFILVLYLFFKFFKIPKIGTLTLNTGGVKTGKSLLTAWFVWRLYIRARFVYFLKGGLAQLLRKPLPEKPLIYSNVPLALPHVALTTDMIMRKVRFAYGSIINICEASLLADSQLYRDWTTTERVAFFAKLIGHETRGGYLLLDTQCINDISLGFRRNLSNYFYIHRGVKGLFFHRLYLKEYIHSEDNSVINVEDKDLEEAMKCVLIPKFVYKIYDRYTYSSLTDNLPVDNYVHYLRKKRREKVSLKSKHIISFNKFIREKLYLSEVSDNEEKNVK